MYNTVIFDLDGTLTDSAPGITNAVAYALHHWGIEVEDKRKLNVFVGPPLLESFQKYYGFSPEQSLEAISVYREYYGDKGLFENVVYAGIPELLQRLKEDGKTVMVATSKPEHFTKRILEHFDLYKYFDFVAGATMDERRTGKAEVLDYLFECHPEIDKAKAVMVGDRENDMHGASHVGIDSIGVLYGYGDFEELSGAGAVHIAKCVEEIYSICR